MSGEDNVLCPYCGGEMEFRYNSPAFFYVCKSCYSHSPHYGSSVDSKRAALKRFKPLQKPMTQGEVIEALKDNDFIAGWFEWKEDSVPMPCTISDWDLEMLHEIGVRFPEETGYDDFDIRENGCEYRIWRQMPTDEEMDAAKWEK